jgi:hypothetical protein
LRPELGGFILAGERSSGRGSHGHRRGELLSGLTGRAPQPGTGAQQLAEGQRAEPLTQAVRGASDQRVQRAAGTSAELDGLGSGCQQHPDRFAFATTPRLSGMNTWRAGCGGSRTSGSEGGPEKPTR